MFVCLQIIESEDDRSKSEQLFDRYAGLMLSKGRIIFEGEFLKFKHSLDGKVFRLCSLQPECKILSTEPDGTKIKYHVYCEDLSLKATDAEEIEPTLEDIWEYYQGGRENG